MTLTAVVVDQVVRPRLAGVITQIDTVAGTSSTVDASLSRAMKEAGYTVASLLTVTDAELAAVSATDESFVVDLAELYWLESLASSYPGMNVKAGTQSMDGKGFVDGLRAMIADKRSAMASRYPNRLPWTKSGRRVARIVYP